MEEIKEAQKIEEEEEIPEPVFNSINSSQRNMHALIISEQNIYEEIPRQTQQNQHLSSRSIAANIQIIS